MIRTGYVIAIVLLVLSSTGCMRRIGANLVEGAFDELAGPGEDPGAKRLLRDLEEDRVVKDLARQVGQGLTAGIEDYDGVTEDQQKSFEQAVDAIITVATTKAGTGLRDEVGPQLREVIRQDLVNTLTEGFRGDLGDSLQETVRRIINTVMVTLRLHIEDPTLRDTLGELIRDSVYIAMREGGASPAVGDTIEETLSGNVLTPMERSVSGIADEVAGRVDESNNRIEQMLQGIISFLVVVVGVGILVLFLMRRQLLRARAESTRQEQRSRAMGVAIQMLDEDMRENLLHAAEDFVGEKIDLPTKPSGHRIEKPRSNEYVRDALGEDKPPDKPDRGGGYER